MNDLEARTVGQFTEIAHHKVAPDWERQNSWSKVFMRCYQSAKDGVLEARLFRRFLEKLKPQVLGAAVMKTQEAKRNMKTLATILSN